MERRSLSKPLLIHVNVSCGTQRDRTVGVHHAPRERLAPYGTMKKLPGWAGTPICEAPLHTTLLPAGILEKPTLSNLMQLYLYDFSALDGADVDACGCFSYAHLDAYWTTTDHHPFLIHVAGCLAGFALINRYSRLHEPFDGHAVAEFFILRKYRRMGAGRVAAIQLFDRFPGRWEVASLATNIPAQSFWRSTIDAYTEGRYQEIWLQNDHWRGPVQSFIAPS